MTLEFTRRTWPTFVIFLSSFGFCMWMCMFMPGAGMGFGNLDYLCHVLAYGALFVAILRFLDDNSIKTHLWSLALLTGEIWALLAWNAIYRGGWHVTLIALPTLGVWGREAAWTGGTLDVWSSFPVIKWLKLRRS
jgi:hypothetical protein